MDTSDKAFALVLLGVCLLFITIFAGCMLESYYIAKAGDPVATACALGKDKVCLVYLGRK